MIMQELLQLKAALFNLVSLPLFKFLLHSNNIIKWVQIKNNLLYQVKPLHSCIQIKHKAIWMNQAQLKTKILILILTFNN